MEQKKSIKEKEPCLVPDKENPCSVPCTCKIFHEFDGKKLIAKNTRILKSIPLTYEIKEDLSKKPSIIICKINPEEPDKKVLYDCKPSKSKLYQPKSKQSLKKINCKSETPPPSCPDNQQNVTIIDCKPKSNECSSQQQPENLCNIQPKQSILSLTKVHKIELDPCAFQGAEPQSIYHISIVPQQNYSNQQSINQKCCTQPKLGYHLQNSYCKIKRQSFNQVSSAPLQNKCIQQQKFCNKQQTSCNQISNRSHQQKQCHQQLINRNNLQQCCNQQKKKQLNKATIISPQNCGNQILIDPCHRKYNQMSIDMYPKLCNSKENVCNEFEIYNQQQQLHNNRSPNKFTQQQNLYNKPCVTEQENQIGYTQQQNPWNPWRYTATQSVGVGNTFHHSCYNQQLQQLNQRFIHALMKLHHLHECQQQHLRHQLLTNATKVCHNQQRKLDKAEAIIQSQHSNCNKKLLNDISIDSPSQCYCDQQNQLNKITARQCCCNQQPKSLTKISNNPLKQCRCYEQRKPPFKSLINSPRQYCCNEQNQPLTKTSIDVLCECHKEQNKSVINNSINPPTLCSCNQLLDNVEASDEYYNQQNKPFIDNSINPLHQCYYNQQTNSCRQQTHESNQQQLFDTLTPVPEQLPRNSCIDFMKNALNNPNTALAIFKRISKDNSNNSSNCPPNQQPFNVKTETICMTVKKPKLSCENKDFSQVLSQPNNEQYLNDIEENCVIDTLSDRNLLAGYCTEEYIDFETDWINFPVQVSPQIPPVKSSHHPNDTTPIYKTNINTDLITQDIRKSGKCTVAQCCMKNGFPCRRYLLEAKGLLPNGPEIVKNVEELVTSDVVN